jgi:predicted ATPase/class 3 adenylate cyclase
VTIVLLFSISKWEYLCHNQFGRTGDLLPIDELETVIAFPRRKSMTNWPSGTVSFLFTDIEGSTKLAQEFPHAMPALLARHHEILYQSFQAQNGYVFQIIGDAFCVAFSSAVEAVTAALDAQVCLFQEEWSPAPVKVRMGIHTGTAQLNEDGQYTGYATLASTQRIVSAGHGGQILLSGATRELVRDTLPPDSELLDLGEKRLKDLMRPEHLYQLHASGLPGTFPPLKTLDFFPNNLPIQLTTFVGREKEISEVKQELAEHRLVTLTGSGGTGKTRLALQVSAELLEKFEQGVWFVELAPLTDPDLIPKTILSAMGVQEQKGKLSMEVLKEFVQEKRLLVVLDNCEHLIAASASVAEALLKASAGLKILASSREALGIKGELSYPVPSLTLPDIKHLPIHDQLSQYEAVRLFIDRAALVSPHFEVDRSNAPAIAQVCYRLDGIPLAIELAAARVKVMSVEQISRRLDDRFRLLTGGARTSLPRQQTLRALIDWSYDLLSENERLLLRRLSVFAGGWTLEAAEEVCAGDGIETYEVLDLLTQLVNKSLVILAEHSQSEETRYRMLETIRQYAREKLMEAGGSEIVRDRHLSYLVKLAEQAKPELYGSNQVFWLNKWEEELDNLRIAMEWALATHVESGLRLIINLMIFLEARCDTREAGTWVAQLLNQYSEADTLRARVLAFYAEMLALQGDVAKGQEMANQSLALSRSLSDPSAEAYSLLILGATLSWQGDLEQSASVMEQSLRLYESLGDKYGQASATSWLVINQQDRVDSKSLLFQNLKFCRELGDLSGIANTLDSLAQRAIWEGDFSSAAQWLEEARTIYRELGNRAGEADILSVDGLLAYWQGDYQQAATQFETSALCYEKIGFSWMASWPRVRIGYTLLQRGDPAQAVEVFRWSVQQFQKANNMIGLVYVLEGFAALYTNHGQPERAARLFAWADVTRDQIGDHRPPVEQKSVEHDLEVIHSQVNDSEFAKLSAEGSSMTTEQAISLALAQDE